MEKGDEIDRIVEQRLSERHNKPDNKALTLRKARNVLNLVFMLGAVAGITVYLSGNRTMGTYIVLAAMVFKIIEAAIRILRL